MPVLVDCPMEDRLEKLGVVMTQMLKVVEKLDLKLEGLCLRIDDTHARITSLEQRMEELNEELANSSSDQQERSGIFN